MAEPQGISKTGKDIARQLVESYRGIQGFRGEVGRNIGNVGRYFASQAPVGAPASPAMQAAADRQAAEVARLGGPAGLQTAMTKGIREANMMRETPQTPQQPSAAGGAGGAGGAANPINALFAPMFQNLRQQRQMANQRYEANSQQVTNIYGQITGARTQDIGALETAFKRLVDAASTRSTAVNTQIDTSEASRLAGNQAALQSMGLEGLSTSQGDIASQGAALAKQTNTLNAENWQNLLRASGVNAQEIARADIAGYNYAMMEDLGQLRGAREEFAQDLGQQRFELQSKKAQATFEYQQAQQRAAAAAKAAKQRARAEMASAEQKAQNEALAGTGSAVPLVNNFVKTGLLAPESGTKVLDFMTEFWTNAQLPAGSTKWTTSSAKAAALAAGKDYLTNQEKTVIQAIIDATVSK
jgi:hypothetical protein